MRVDPPGLAARRISAWVAGHVLSAKVSVDAALAAAPGLSELDGRDRSFVVASVMATLRYRGALSAVLGRFLARALPRKSGSTENVLLTSLAQLLVLRNAPHAVIDQAVDLAREDRHGRHFSGLVNAVLRRAATAGEVMLQEMDVARAAVPDWAWTRWVGQYGEETARRIAAAHLEPAAVDLSFRDGEGARLAGLPGVALPGGSFRLDGGHDALDVLPGFAEGGWWVQDVAAAIPVRLLGDVGGLRVLDLCAAPGGKTLQLAAAGARVTAVDRSGERLGRLRDNLGRTGLSAEVIEGDAGEISVGEPFDRVLLDAPCSATGTVRRHPELLHIRSGQDIQKLAGVQARLLRKAGGLVKPGGLMIFVTCSLEREEGEDQVARFLAENPNYVSEPLKPGLEAVPPGMITPEGYLRTLPWMALGPAKGMDGFFAARFRRLS